MSECKNIAIRWDDNDDNYILFMKAKEQYDKERKKRGERPTKCAEFAKILINKTLMK